MPGPRDDGLADTTRNDAQLRLAVSLADARSVDEVAASVARWGAQAACASLSTVTAFDPDDDHVRAVHDTCPARDFPPSSPESHVDAPTPLTEAFVTGRVVLLGDLEQLGERYPDLCEDMVACGLRATAALPLRVTDGANIGAIGFAWETAQRFSAAQISRLELTAQLVAGALERVTGSEPDPIGGMRQGEARALQEALLPALPHQLEGLDLAAACLPADDAPMGGDWYDVFPVEGGHCLVLGDVAGHGLAQAALMTAIRNAVRAFADEDPDPASVVTRVNRMFCRLHPGKTATLIVATWDPSQRILTRCNAGHPPVLRCRMGEFAYLPRGAANGPMIGADRTYKYRAQEKILRPGTTLLFYSDGLIEINHDNVDTGMRNLLEFAESRPSLSPRRLIEDVLAWRVGQGPLDDDLCLLAVRLG